MRVFFYIVIAAAFSSCAPKIYLPDRVNAPMLREAGEVKLTSSVKMQNNANAPHTVVSPSFDLAVSPVNGLGIIASFRNTNRYSDDNDAFNYTDQDSILYSGNKGELGIGYYMPFGGRGLFDLYGGFGFGSMYRDNLGGGAGNYRAGYYQLFVQPSVGFYANDVFDMCGGVRFSMHKYNKFATDTLSFRYEFTDPRTDLENPNFFILGPFINLNVGYQYIKFNMQFGANANISKPRLTMNNPFYMSLGLTFAFAPRFRLGEGTGGRSKDREYN
jgi:hypothetical protein